MKSDDCHKIIKMENYKQPKEDKLGWESESSCFHIEDSYPMQHLAPNEPEVVVPKEDDNEMFSWKTFWAYTGPGWMLCITFLDPGNLESDLQGGGYAYFSVLWVVFWSTVLAWFIQMLSVKLGVVTGNNLAQVCRDNYTKWSANLIWISAEIAIIGSDIQEILGSAIAIQLLFNIPLWIGCMITAIVTFLFLFIRNCGIRKLEFFFCFLIFIMLICFSMNLIKGGVDLKAVVKGNVIPTMNSRTTNIIVAIIGAVVMPQNIFLHSALVKSRGIDRNNDRRVREANKYFGIESAIALFISFLVNFAVLGVFATAFYSNDCEFTFDSFGVHTACIDGESSEGTTYGTCEQLVSGMNGVCKELGLAAAGKSLESVLGNYGEIFWGIGLLAAGLASTMTGIYAGQFVMEGFLSLHVAPWKRVLLTRLTALIPAVIVATLSQSNPSFSDNVGQMLNILQSIQLPFALLPLLHFTNSKEIMKSHANSIWISTLGWSTGFLIIVVNLYLVLSKSFSMELGVFSLIAIGIAAFIYISILGYLIKDDLKKILPRDLQFFQTIKISKEGTQETGTCGASIDRDVGMVDPWIEIDSGSKSNQ